MSHLGGGGLGGVREMGKIQFHLADARANHNLTGEGGESGELTSFLGLPLRFPPPDGAAAAFCWRETARG